MFRIILLLLVFSRSGFATPSSLGIYDLDVQIGNTSFKDILELTALNEQKIEGEFSVPQVFKAKFMGTVIKHELEGSFMANENGGEFLVILKAKFSGSYDELTGVLMTESQVFAKFSGRKRAIHE